MKIQLFQNEVPIIGNESYALGRDAFRIFIEQNESEHEKISGAYLAASDLPYLNDYLVKSGKTQAWMYSCAAHCSARSHPFELCGINYNHAGAFNTREEILEKGKVLGKNAPAAMSDLLDRFPDVGVCQEMNFNWCGDEVYGGFHCYVSAYDDALMREYKGKELYLTIVIAKRNFPIPNADSRLTIDLIEMRPLTISFG
jgi:hypothetical protein